LYEAMAMGADDGILLSDPAMAGGDTYATSYTLARTIEKQCPDFDLVLCGCFTSDSETSQVGPQLAEELDIPAAAYVEDFEIKGRKVRMQRISDNFLEIMEMAMPGLMTITTRSYVPRYPTLGSLDEAFEHQQIKTFKAKDLGLDLKTIGRSGSPTRIINVYSPTAEKKNVVLKGTAKKVVDDILAGYGDKISGGKALRPHKQGNGLRAHGGNLKPLNPYMRLRRVEKRTAEFRISNRRISKDGFARAAQALAPRVAQSFL
ncbi:MAG: electron transfer flavoprotein subunit beta/FixA family protein, partial [Deltaproteobacteria bacterium]|nr:electron transfer flavoprotein subunit beta/FixA family protein [Deltaproteobacteria bacterium]